MTIYSNGRSANEQLIYTRTTDDLHLFEFYHIDRNVIDDCFAVLAPLYIHTPPNEVLRFVMDMRVTRLDHLTYAFQRWRMLIRELEENFPRGCLAIIHERHTSIAMLDAMMRIQSNRNITWRYFQPDDYTCAMAWLQDCSI